MKAKLIVEGREFPIEIQDPELVKLLKPQKKTGYERVDKGGHYFYACSDGFVESALDMGTCSQDDYDNADYYSDQTVAENNARADKLMRQLRRFAVEHRSHENDWTDTRNYHYYIMYNHNTNTLCSNYNQCFRIHGIIYFNDQKTAELAIKTFHDELIWYFTEYEDSL